MYETAIENALKKDSFTSKIFGGVLARDELPKNVDYPSCYVVNTKPRTNSGEHWLAIYYDKNGHADFFDSYGHHPQYFFLDSFLNKTSTSWSFNKIRLQGLSTFCGYYCLLYLFFRSRQKSNIFFSFFNNNSLLNDKKITYYIKKFKEK